MQNKIEWLRERTEHLDIFLFLPITQWCSISDVLFTDGIRGLMRGMANLPQGNQELLVVRDKVGRLPSELGVSKSVECDIFPSVL